MTDRFQSYLLRISALLFLSQVETAEAVIIKFFGIKIDSDDPIVLASFIACIVGSILTILVVAAICTRICCRQDIQRSKLIRKTKKGKLKVKKSEELRSSASDIIKISSALGSQKVLLPDSKSTEFNSSKSMPNSPSTRAINTGPTRAGTVRAQSSLRKEVEPMSSTLTRQLSNEGQLKRVDSVKQPEVYRTPTESTAGDFSTQQAISANQKTIRTRGYTSGDMPIMASEQQDLTRQSSMVERQMPNANGMLNKSATMSASIQRATLSKYATISTNRAPEAEGNQNSDPGKRPRLQILPPSASAEIQKPPVLTPTVIRPSVGYDGQPFSPSSYGTQSGFAVADGETQISEAVVVSSARPSAPLYSDDGGNATLIEEAMFPGHTDLDNSPTRPSAPLYSDNGGNATLIEEAMFPGHTDLDNSPTMIEEALVVPVERKRFL